MRLADSWIGSNEDGFFESERMLERWHFVVGSNGCLWIRPADEFVPFAELASFVRQLMLAGDLPNLREIVLDLSGCEVTGQGRSGTTSLLRQLSVRLGVRCRVIGGAARRTPLIADICDRITTFALAV